MQGQSLPTSSDGLGGNSVGVLKHMNLAGKWADTYQVGMSYVCAHTSEMGQDAFSYSLKTQESRASESHVRNQREVLWCTSRAKAGIIRVNTSRTVGGKLVTLREKLELQCLSIPLTGEDKTEITAQPALENTSENPPVLW